MEGRLKFADVFSATGKMASAYSFTKGREYNFLSKTTDYKYAIREIRREKEERGCHGCQNCGFNSSWESGYALSFSYNCQNHGGFCSGKHQQQQENLDRECEKRTSRPNHEGGRKCTWANTAAFIDPEGE